MATTAGDTPNTSSVPDGDGSGDGSVPPAAEPTLPPAPPPRTPNRFFDWIRGLGILRTRGWIGGVCAGIAARLGIDPILVRGIVVVIAVLGGPVVLLYAAAWLLLPDDNDVIHAEELGRGRFTPAIAGIGALALLSLLPLTQGFWYAGAQYWGEPNAGASIGRVLWTALLIAGLVFFVLWIARRSSESTAAAPPGVSGADGTTTPYAAAATPYAAAATPDAPDGAAAGAPPAAGFAPEPASPGADASAEELAAWRRQQDDWRRQRAAWAAEQKRTDRELAAQVAREKARRNAEEAIERARIRRLTRPRISGAFVLLTIGLAIVAGALSALLWPNDGGGYDATVGWAAAVFVLGAAIAVAGALRRRSGFLTFLSIVSLLILLATTAVPSGRQLIWPGASLTISSAESAQYAQPVGTLDLQVRDDGDDEVAEIDIWQGRGTVTIWVDPGQTVRVDALTEGRDVHLTTRQPDGSETEVADSVTFRPAEEDRFASSTVAGADGEPDVIVTLWQGRGSVFITELPE